MAMKKADLIWHMEKVHKVDPKIMRWMTLPYLREHHASFKCDVR